MAPTMKEALVSKTTDVTIHDVAIPEPKANQVLIKVIVTGTNPKDWKVPLWRSTEPTNQGDDIAGYVEAVGDNVTEFKPGDRVAAFHEMMTPNGSYAEYAIAWAHTTFHLPKATSFEEAATIPLAAMTAALGLYQRLKLPLPWSPATSPVPLIVYGAASAVGAFAIKLATLSNIHPIIAVAGRGIPYVETLIDQGKGDKIIDYRDGDAAVVEGIKSVTGGKKIVYAFDAVSEKTTVENIVQVLDKENGKITLVLPYKGTTPEGIQVRETMVGTVNMPVDSESVETKPGVKIGDKEFGAALYRFMMTGLAEGWFSGHPYEVVKGGLGGLEGALRNLKDGKASAVKYVARIDETEGVQKK